MSELNAQVEQLARSAPHQMEVGALHAMPNLIATINQREQDRLIRAVERLLGAARLIALDLPTFQLATDYRTRFALDIEDAIILSSVLADLRTAAPAGRHLFANRNRKDFAVPGIVAALGQCSCELVWSFAEAAMRLGIEKSLPNRVRRRS